MSNGQNRRAADIGISRAMAEEFTGKIISDEKWSDIIRNCQDDCVAASTNIIEDYLDDDVSN